MRSGDSARSIELFDQALASATSDDPRELIRGKTIEEEVRNDQIEMILLERRFENVAMQIGDVRSGIEAGLRDIEHTAACVDAGDLRAWEWFNKGAKKTAVAFADE